ncbi:hypothetical protein JCM1841_001680, partial [Sporobolomyces salmonicolor]
MVSASYRSAFAAIVTLFLFAATVSHAHPEAGPSRFIRRSSSLPSSAIKIPLQKRRFEISGITAGDGVVDLSSLNSQLTRVQHKYFSGASYYYKRTGRKLPGFRLDKAVEQFLGSTLSPLSGGILKRQSGADTLTNEEDGAMWSGPISVGTPAQNLTIDFDTGSADLWVASPESNAGLNTYNPNASSTAVPTGKNLDIMYGDGSTVSGPIYQDTVSVAGVDVTNAYVAAANTVSTSFQNGPVDGVLGMAYETISNSGDKPWFQTAYSEGLVSQNSFSFLLGNASDGELHLGGTDESKYQGAINYTPVTQQGYWMINGDAGVNGNNTVSSQSLIIDTGTTLIVAPPSVAKTFFASVPTARKWKSGYYIYKCAEKWTAEFTFNGQSYTVPSEYLNLGRTQAGSFWCVAGVAAQ